MSRCRSCGAEITFIRTISGNLMPCDADPVIYWAKKGGSQKVITPEGLVISCELSGDPEKATGSGYISHFATCPDANKFRRRK